MEIKWDATKDELKQAEHVYMRRAFRGRKTYFVIDPDNNLMATFKTLRNAASKTSYDL